MKFLKNLFTTPAPQTKETRIYQRDLNNDSLHALLRALEDFQNTSNTYVTELVNQEESRDAILNKAQEYLEEQGVFYIYNPNKEHSFTLDQRTLTYIAYVYIQTIRQPRQFAVDLILETYGIK
jgi:predicted transcriptional regulator YheO